MEKLPRNKDACRLAIPAKLPFKYFFFSESDLIWKNVNFIYGLNIPTLGTGKDISTVFVNLFLSSTNARSVVWIYLSLHHTSISKNKLRLYPFLKVKKSFQKKIFIWGKRQ